MPHLRRKRRYSFVPLRTLFNLGPREQSFRAPRKLRRTPEYTSTAPLRDRYQEEVEEVRYKPRRSHRRRHHDVPNFSYPLHKQPRSDPRTQYQYQEPSSHRRTSSRDYYHHPNLSSLPPELKLSIISSLDPVSSTCLGLTSKSLYPLHRSVHGSIGLFDTPSSPENALPLCFRLKTWLPKDMVLDSRTEKLRRRDKWEEEDREMRRREKVWDGRRWDEGSRRGWDTEPVYYR